jgi:hypothetical protein
MVVPLMLTVPVPRALSEVEAAITPSTYISAPVSVAPEPAAFREVVFILKLPTPTVFKLADISIEPSVPCKIEPVSVAPDPAPFMVVPVTVNEPAPIDFNQVFTTVTPLAEIPWMLERIIRLPKDARVGVPSAVVDGIGWLRLAVIAGRTVVAAGLVGDPAAAGTTSDVTTSVATVVVTAAVVVAAVPVAAVPVAAVPVAAVPVATVAAELPVEVVVLPAVAPAVALVPPVVAPAAELPDVAVAPPTGPEFGTIALIRLLIRSVLEAAVAGSIALLAIAIGFAEPLTNTPAAGPLPVSTTPTVALVSEGRPASPNSLSLGVKPLLGAVVVVTAVDIVVLADVPVGATVLALLEVVLATVAAVEPSSVAAVVLATVLEVLAVVAVPAVGLTVVLEVLDVVLAVTAVPDAAGWGVGVGVGVLLCKKTLAARPWVASTEIAPAALVVPSL